MSDADITEIKRNIQSYKNFLKISLIALLPLAIILIGAVHYSFTFLGLYLKALISSTLTASPETFNLSSIFISMTAFLTSLFAVIVSTLFPCYEAKRNLEGKLSDDKLKKIEDEIMHIEDSISLFYIPLQNLLTVYNKSESEEDKLS